MPESEPKPTRLEVRHGGRIVFSGEVFDFSIDKDGEALTVRAATQPTLPETEAAPKPKRSRAKKAAPEPEPEPEVEVETEAE